MARYKCYKYTLDHNCFSKLTPECLYWLGFIAADGYIKSIRDKTNRIKIELQGQDSGHIQKFIDFVKTNKEPDNYTRKTRGKEHTVSRIEIFSDNIIKDLWK